MNDTVRPRAYYAARKYGSKASDLSLNDLQVVILSAYEHYEGSGYFVEAFGFSCTDSGFEPGYAGSNVGAYVRLSLDGRELWPIYNCYKQYSEEDAFTLIEFLFDHISKPMKRDWHDWNNCGFHYSDFNRELGREEYRERVNISLKRYGIGWELTSDGEILSLPPESMSTLLTAKLPTNDMAVIKKVELATQKFRRHGSSVDDRTDAVRDLADVLEWLRSQIKETLLKADENDLFNLANNFGIRHMNQRQKLKYDKVVWLSWMFYHYLNTIHAFLHMVKRQKGNS